MTGEATKFAGTPFTRDYSADAFMVAGTAISADPTNCPIVYEKDCYVTATGMGVGGKLASDKWNIKASGNVLIPLDVEFASGAVVVQCQYKGKDIAETTAFEWTIGAQCDSTNSVS